MNLKFYSITGQVAYEAVRQLQLEWVDLRASNLVPDTVFFLEHHPVITRGRGLQFTGTPRPRQMPAPSLLPPSISFSESERGGDLTYHGPGQLVIYPILKLDGTGLAPHHDVAGYLRKLESILIDELESKGLQGRIEENATGVWVDSKKIASIGIAVKKWVTYHGVALNVVNSMEPFYLFSPCGFQPEVMTRLQDWMKIEGDWRTELEDSIASRMVASMKSQPDFKPSVEKISLDRLVDLSKSFSTNTVQSL